MPQNPFSDGFSRNCLENSFTRLDRVFLVAQSGNKGASRLVLPPHGPQGEAHLDLPNSFSETV
jgi:hypothetical protein